ncbi:16S rRNA (guanine(966)-N(2))-methyltransferase RsmD [Salininema proteolyticum]|uniref:16S rRNA (Guanine(966)-N(2))-methyltransferase RsmD n=1 Tax=Salininema proteolyticum TaxID=1607685 RepID=A0ABV8TYU9_9ACTN
MTRIIAGTAKGRRLRTPAGDRTRPTSDRVREALFSALAPGGDLEDLRVLDLYAGSGAVGLEALSRGAARAVFVESHAPTAKLIRQNADDLGFGDRVQVERASATTFAAAAAGEKFDIVFADPPYDVPDETVAALLADLAANGWLALDADLVVERGGKHSTVEWPEGVSPRRHRKYGSTTLWYGDYS